MVIKDYNSVCHNNNNNNNKDDSDDDEDDSEDGDLMTRTMRKVKMMRMMVMINGLSNMYFLVYFRGPSIRTVHYGIAASCK